MPTNKKDSQATPVDVIGGMQSERLTEISGISSQRRKLIKASAAAVPALMTLRSGAAAAVASSYQCLRNQDISNADKILGDYADDLPHDQWVRVLAVAGKVIQYNTSNGMGVGTTKTVYGIMQTAYSWENSDNWKFYDETGTETNPNGNNFDNAFPNDTAVFYYVPTIPDHFDPLSPQLVCKSDVNGVDNCPAIPEDVKTKIIGGPTTVQLLAFYDEQSGYLYNFPNNPDRALPYTASCLCSIDPTFQKL